MKRKWGRDYRWYFRYKNVHHKTAKYVGNK